jgi:hypothetical protein
MPRPGSRMPSPNDGEAYFRFSSLFNHPNIINIIMRSTVALSRPFDVCFPSELSTFLFPFLLGTGNQESGTPFQVQE